MTEIEDSIQQRLVQLRAAFNRNDSHAVNQLSAPFQFDGPHAFSAFKNVVLKTTDNNIHRLAYILASNTYSGIKYSHPETNGNQSVASGPA